MERRGPACTHDHMEEVANLEFDTIEYWAFNLGLKHHF